MRNSLQMEFESNRGWVNTYLRHLPFSFFLGGAHSSSSSIYDISLIESTRGDLYLSFMEAYFACFSGMVEEIDSTGT